MKTNNDCSVFDTLNTTRRTLVGVLYLLEELSDYPLLTRDVQDSINRLDNVLRSDCATQKNS